MQTRAASLLNQDVSWQSIYRVPKDQSSQGGMGRARGRKPRIASWGRKIHLRPLKTFADRIDIPGSILQAWKRGRASPGVEDLFTPVFVSPLSRLVIFVLDVSESMSTGLEMMRAWILESMQRAYYRRDPVAVITFQADTAVLLVHPTKSLGFVLHKLNQVQVAGGTPLDQALFITRRTMIQLRDHYKMIDVCFITDGRSTSSLDTSEVKKAAALIRANAREILVVNPLQESKVYTSKLASMLRARLA